MVSAGSLLVSLGSSVAGVASAGLGLSAGGVEHATKKAAPMKEKASSVFDRGCDMGGV